MDRNWIYALLCGALCSLAACGQDYDEDGFVGEEDCAPHARYEDGRDFNNGCGCNGEIGIRGCAANPSPPDAGHPPVDAGHPPADGGSPPPGCTDGDTRPCGPQDENGSFLNRGRCRIGIQRCIDGAWEPVCVGAVLPASAEECNGIDDDCDGEVDEGFDLASDPARCGGCGIVCDLPHAVSSCAEGRCVIARCQAGFYDVDGEDDNGCEYGLCVPTNGGVERCDGLDNDCDGLVDEEGCECIAESTDVCGIAEGRCERGVRACVDGLYGACEGAVGPQSEVCNYLDDDCDGEVDNGFDLLADVANCGFCGRACSFPNAAARCEEGDCVMGACHLYWHDVDGDDRNGCEYPCVPHPGGLELCNGVDDTCDGEVDEGFALDTDPLNCGSCGRVCHLANAVPACRDGGCVVAGCLDGFVNLDGQDANGCEYACSVTNGGVEACDGLDNNCDGTIDEQCACVPGSTRVCNQRPGQCRPGVQTCHDPGIWGACEGDVGPQPEQCNGLDDDCDGEPDNGFAFASDPKNCGACGNVCHFDRAAALCVAGACTMGACNPFWYDLDGQDANGCEYGPCIVRNNGIEACNGIDDNCDGEVDEGFALDTDPLNCGACNNVCTMPNATPACVDGACAVGTCAPGFHDLNGNPADGCEYACVVTNGGVEACDGLDNNCNGAVDELCACYPGSTRVCNQRPGQCRPGTQTCHDPGVWGSCEGVVDPVPEQCNGLDDDCDDVPDNGYDLDGDVNHCGGCGIVCAFAQASASCVDGACVMGACDPFFHNANGNAADGCEYACVPFNGGVELCNGRDDDCDGEVDETFDVQTDPTNCGQCGNVCALYRVEQQACVSGACTVAPGACAADYHDVNGDPADGCEYFCRPTNGGAEICDGIDNDCDGIVDNAVMVCVPPTEPPDDEEEEEPDAGEEPPPPATPVGNVHCEVDAENASVVNVTVTGAVSLGLNPGPDGTPITQGDIATIDLGQDNPFTWLNEVDPTQPPPLDHPVAYTGDNRPYVFTEILRVGPDATGRNKFAPRVRDANGAVLAYFRIVDNWTASGACALLCANNICNVQVQ